MIPTTPDLRRFLMEFFDDEEIETLCLDYFPEVGQNFTVGMTKNRKALMLIGFCERRDRLGDLAAALDRERPESWKRLFTAPAAPQPARPLATPAAATPRDPRQVFLSHANQDAEFAGKLAGDLRGEEWRVWMAPDSIRPGEKWVEAIERGLAESGVFLLVLTPDAVASRWVRTEAAAAIDLEHQGEVRIIPLELAPGDAPLLWRQYQYVPFRRGYESGLDALLARLDDPATSGPARDPAPAIFPTAGKADPEIAPLPTAAKPPDGTAAPVVAGKKEPAAPRSRSKAALAPPPLRPSRRIHEKTGIELIVIPAGKFLYGAPESDKLSNVSERPQRTITLPEFEIGRAPVTNVQYDRFLKANPDHPRPPGWTTRRKNYLKGKADHPVLVTLADAEAFCHWAGLRLPTDQEWEKAARGTDGRRWPWGDKPPTAAHANVRNFVGDTTPVGAYSPLGDSPYGCVDMSGNINEWTSTPFSFEPWQIIRGGNWSEENRYTRTTRQNITQPTSAVGFRVVSDG